MGDRGVEILYKLVDNLLMEEELKNVLPYKKSTIVASVILLILAIFPWPYGYYIFLRWVVAVTGILLAYTAHLMGKSGWVVAFVLLSLLFNPVIPFHLDRETWQVFDLLGAGVFLLALIGLKQK